MNHTHIHPDPDPDPDMELDMEPDLDLDPDLKFEPYLEPEPDLELEPDLASELELGPILPNVASIEKQKIFHHLGKVQCCLTNLLILAKSKTYEFPNFENSLVHFGVRVIKITNNPF